MKHQHRLNTARRALASSCGIDHVTALNFRASCLWLLVGAALWLMPSSSVGADRAEEFTRDILPVLKKKCFDCHGPESQKADLNLSVFPDFTSVTNNLEIWHGVLERVSAFEMPPKKATQLSFDEQGRLVRWLRDLPKSSPPDCSQLASDRTANFYKGYVMSRRLNREEYINTLRDLFGVRIPVEHLLPADGGGGEGFDTTGSALFLSSIHIEKYMAAAEEAVNLILPESTSKMPQELKLARDRILPRAPRNRADQPRAAREILARFSEKAWRRPVTSEETDKLMALFQRGHERRDTFITSLRLALRGVLISPHFLFLAEPEPAQGGIHPLGAYPLASKLSYFLWSSMPDAQLISRAQDGTLLDTNVYRAEVRRMLKDPKARALGERFAIQWLDLDRLGTEIKPDPSRFPEFTEELKSDLLHEVVAASGHIFQNNRSLLEFIDSDYAFINQRLAKLYGIEGVEGSEFRQVKLSDRTRGGVIGMGAVHTVTSYPLRTSPVLRGRWVLESLLGEKVPPPPPDVPALDEKGTQHSPKSIREQLEIHRSKADCAACHDKMDPLGFGMENFDSLGRFRSSEAGQPIDTEGVLPSGKRFKGADGLKSVLMERKESVIRHMTRKMTGYAYGRELTKFDECVVNSTMAALSSNEYRSETLVESIAMSFPFRHRFYPKQN